MDSFSGTFSSSSAGFAPSSTASTSFLELDQPCVVHAVPLDAGRRAARIIQAVPFLELSCHDQVDVEIDALLLQLRCEIIKPIQTLRVELSAAAGRIVQKRSLFAAAPASRFLSHRGICRMEPDDIYPHAGEPLRQLIRRLMIRRVGARRYVEPQESRPRAVRKEKVPSPCADEPMLPRRSIQQVRVVQEPCVRLCLVNPYMLFHGVFLLAFPTPAL